MFSAATDDDQGDTCGRRFLAFSRMTGETLCLLHRIRRRRHSVAKFLKTSSWTFRVIPMLHLVSTGDVFYWWCSPLP
jgi:hypothetical protein